MKLSETGTHSPVPRRAAAASSASVTSSQRTRVASPVEVRASATDVFEGTAREYISPPASASANGCTGAQSHERNRLRLQQLLALRTAQAELGGGDRNAVEDRSSPNRGAAPDKYNAGLKDGMDWCGSFVEWCYRQNGFRHRDVLSSVWKAEQFFQGTRPEGTGRMYTSVDVSTAASAYDVRPGDVAIFEDHVGIVESYDPSTGRLVLVEGNVGWQDGTGYHEGIERREYWLPDAAAFDADPRLKAFGRPAPCDFSWTPIQGVTGPGGYVQYPENPE